MRRFTYVLIVLTILALLGITTASIVVFAYGQVDRAEPADVIVILGAGTRGNGTASPAYARRIRHAVSLYERGLAPLLMCTGGFANTWRTVPEAESCRKYLLDLGIPASAILMETESTSTEENAIYAKQVMVADNLNSAILVTDNFHLFRAKTLFDAQGVTVYPSPAQATGTELRFTTAMTSTVREVLALGWQFVKSVAGLDVTSTPF
ncbi:MAG: YdcF family protein [Anaerolineae bacterium]|nr:YdcF family protein [Anaerolineae bacterium]